MSSSACLSSLLLACLSCPQVQAVADAAFFQGYIDEQQRLHASTLQLETVQLIAVGERKQRCFFAMRAQQLETVHCFFIHFIFEARRCG